MPNMILPNQTEISWKPMVSPMPNVPKSLVSLFTKSCYTTVSGIAAHDIGVLPPCWCESRINRTFGDIDLRWPFLRFVLLHHNYLQFGKYCLNSYQFKEVYMFLASYMFIVIELWIVLDWILADLWISSSWLSWSWTMMKLCAGLYVHPSERPWT